MTEDIVKFIDRVIGERVVSRLHRMCNLLFINGKDRRR